jgi:orotidine-5'-phosphate decarboxylase
MKNAKSRLIVALDLPGRDAALAALDQLSGHVGYFKVGLELFIREGPKLVEEILAREQKVFLDLKLHDIPNTVAGAVRSACRLGIHMMTIHAAGGPSMLKAAHEASQEFQNPPLLLAVTALTSLSSDDARSIGIAPALPQWVERLAGVAKNSGIKGLVASPKELPTLRGMYGDSFCIVTPGIRPSGSPTQDQARAAQPGEAIGAGADFLVVGRPILNAPDPVHAAESIVREIHSAL